MDNEAYLNAERASQNYARMRRAVVANGGTARPAPRQIDARKAGRLKARREAAEIARLCVAAGSPELAAEFLIAGKSVAEVQASLATAAAATAHDALIARALAQLDIDKSWARAFEQARTGRRPG
jgi:hypothetical protein